jgi:chitin disaccharide deacetylase
MRAIINADDFGYSADTVRATIECIERGAVTSATIMPNMGATGEALRYARNRGGVSFGVHLTLVDDVLARPLAAADRIPALLTGRGTLLPTNVVRTRALLGRLPVDQLEEEITAQIEHVVGSGVPVSHVDSHRNVHKLPNVRRALERVLPRFGITRVRSAQDVYLRRPLTSPTVWLGRRWSRGIVRRFETTDHLYIPTSAADRGWDEALAFRLRRLAGDTIEIAVHPGHEEEWRREELRAVERFANAARRDGHELVTWVDAFAPDAERARISSRREDGKRWKVKQ